jgi:uridine kinase
MKGTSRSLSPLPFSEFLFKQMVLINPGIKKMALYEFRYALDGIFPKDRWDSLELNRPNDIVSKIRQRSFYENIQTKPRQNDRIVLNESIANLTQMLFVGLVRGEYSLEWVNEHFYFDIRGFYFLPRTVYLTQAGSKHFGGKPLLRFENGQKRFNEYQDIGYLDFQEANLEIDHAFIAMIQDVIDRLGTPILITLAGPTASGKTEITERLIDTIEKTGKKTNTIEMDNFLLDRDYRDNKPMGKETIHFDLFQHSLVEIKQGRQITIPRYDSITATSSHDLQGKLRPGGHSITVEPADIIFLEGNFPFHINELAGLIALKVVYLTDDPIRLKRKWKRDIDYRKNYDPAHFRNRFFVTQYLRAEDCYRPQIEKSDIFVNTTDAAIWVTPEIMQTLKHI